jgi:hypothetical protein
MKSEGFHGFQLVLPDTTISFACTSEKARAGSCCIFHRCHSARQAIPCDAVSYACDIPHMAVITWVWGLTAAGARRMG